MLTYAKHRIWDVENKRKQNTVIVVKSKERGARTKVTTCCYSTSGSQIVGGLCHGPRFARVLPRLTFLSSLL